MKLNGFERKDNDQISFDISKEDLQEILSAIKFIASIENEDEALKKTESLINQLKEQFSIIQESNYRFQEDLEWDQEQRENVLDEIKDFKYSIIDIENVFKNDKDFNFRRIDEFKNSINWFADDWDRKYKNEFKEIIENLKKEAEIKIVSIEKEYYINLPRKNLIREIYSVSSVNSIIREIDDAEKYLEKNNLLNNDILKECRLNRERVAWFRAKKKLSEAEVFRGGGNIKKADKLEGEAKVLLIQDWGKIFPTEVIPEINEQK